MRRLLAIGFIWICCSAAWAVLASTLAVRSGMASGDLLPEVQALWGPALVQAPPAASGTETHRERRREQKYDEKEKRYFAVERDADVTTERELTLFLLACAFFAFHLLFAYLIDHVEVAPAFAIASAVSVALVITYARLFVGWRVAVVQMGLSQLLYLVLFSVSFFWKGFTGLAIAVGATVTLFVLMQITGRLDWERVLSRSPGAGAGAGPA